MLGYKDFLKFGRGRGILTPLSWRESKCVTKKTADITSTFLKNHESTEIQYQTCQSQFSFSS